MKVDAERRVTSADSAIRISSLELLGASSPTYGTTNVPTWSIVSGFKGLENDVVILAGLTDIDDDWYRGLAYVGMSRARTRSHVLIHEDCDAKRQEREVEWEARGRGMWRRCCGSWERRQIRFG